MANRASIPTIAWHVRRPWCGLSSMFPQPIHDTRRTLIQTLQLCVIQDTPKSARPLQCASIRVYMHSDSLSQPEWKRVHPDPARRSTNRVRIGVAHALGHDALVRVLCNRRLAPHSIGRTYASAYQLSLHATPSSSRNNRLQIQRNQECPFSLFTRAYRAVR